MTSHGLAFCAALLLSTGFSAAADAADFISRRNFAGGASATLRITTDDTLGVLSQSNIVDFSAVLSNGSVTVTLDDDLHTFVLDGSALIASPGQLFYDFDEGGVIALIDATIPFDGYCIDSVGGAGSCLGAPPSETIVIDAVFYSASNLGSGRTLFATVPDPASWAMMILGFGLLGSSARGRAGRNARSARG